MSKASKEIPKSHNVTVLLYHVVFAIKYRRIVINEDVARIIHDVCCEIELRYDIHFLEVGTDLDHLHFLIQSVPDYSVTKIVRTVKSILSREVFRQCSQVKKILWGGAFFGKGYSTNTVGQHGTENMIANYVKNQGKHEEYRQLSVGGEQLKLFTYQKRKKRVIEYFDEFYSIINNPKLVKRHFINNVCQVRYK